MTAIFLLESEQDMNRRVENVGLTLIELLIAAFVLSVGIVSTLLFFSSAMLSADFAGDITVASTHAEHVFEEMRSRNSLLDIASTNWEQWAEAEQLNSLPNEYFKVNFTNAESNPLEVTLDVDWTKRSRNHKVTMYTTVLK